MSRDNQISQQGLSSRQFASQSVDELFIILNSSSFGLTVVEAEIRLREYGANAIKIERTQVWRQLLRRFGNPLVLVLLVASGISAATGEVASFLIITLMVLFSVALDFFQQFRAEQAAEKLKQSVTVKATVLRDRKFIEIPFADLVPGDVVQLSAGDLVPADCIVIEGKDLYLNQSLLTGESYPVEKIPRRGPRIKPLDEEAVGGFSKTAVYMGTSVVSGTGRILVCRTGTGTAIGEIADSLNQEPPVTAFELGLNRFGILIMRLAVALVLFVILVNAIYQRPLLESFLFAIALAVGLTPELLPMVVTVTLSRGAMRLAKSQVIVKKMGSIQNLGGMDVLCSDKTGTLTEGKIVLERHVDIQGKDSDVVLKLAFLNSFFDTGLKSPIDQAILAHQLHQEMKIEAWKKIDEVPFDFERRRISVLVEHDGRRYLIVKGATEEILKNAEYHSVAEFSGAMELDEIHRVQVTKLRENFESQGFRAIAVAWKEVEISVQQATVTDETDLVLAGICAFHDPPKVGIGKVIQQIQQDLQVGLKVITGDSELVTRHLFSGIGVPVSGVLTGAELQQMAQDALEARVDHVNLFCRMAPGQKNRVIQALRSRNHTVGYLGDGVNDAPSLRTADVGISVDGAVDVAKDAADIILLQKNLGVLVEGIKEGRRTHANIMKYIMMGASSNLGNMISMAGATLVLPFLPMLPIQVLLNNFLYDLSEVAIPLDRVDAEQLLRPQKWDIGFIHQFMWVLGLVSSAFDFLTFYVLRNVFHADERLFHTGWFVESIATQVLVIFIIRTHHRPWRSRPSLVLAVTSVTVVILAALLPFSPLADDLQFAPLSWKFYGILAMMICSYLLIVELVKTLYFRWRGAKLAG